MGDDLGHRQIVAVLATRRATRWCRGWPCRGARSSSYYNAVGPLLKRGITDVFCHNDRVAMGLCDGLRERGVTVPDDLAVVGFDNQEVIAAHLRPPLSTVALPHCRTTSSASPASASCSGWTRRPPTAGSISHARRFHGAR